MEVLSTGVNTEVSAVLNRYEKGTESYNQELCPLLSGIYLMDATKPTFSTYNSGLSKSEKSTFNNTFFISSILL